MKKVITIISIAAIAIVLVFSCSKEDATNNNNDCKSCKEGELLALKINNFKEQLKTAKANPKNVETLTMDEAIENMELLINASHGFPFEEYTERVNETVSIQLPVDAEGNVSLTDVSTAYDEMISMVRDVYVNTGFEEKGLIVVSVYPNEEDKSGQTINVGITTGKVDPGNSDDFDCWYYGENLGKCDGSSYMVKDGGDSIAEAIAMNNPILGYNDCPGPNYHIVLNQQPEITREGYEYQMPGGDYYIFFLPDDGSGFTLEEKILQIEDMEYYYDNEYSVIYSIVPQQYNYLFPDYVLVNCIINGEPFINPLTDILTLHHQNKLTYARRYWVEDDIIPSPTPID